MAKSSFLNCIREGSEKLQEKGRDIAIKRALENGKDKYFLMANFGMCMVEAQEYIEAYNKRCKEKSNKGKEDLKER